MAGKAKTIIGGLLVFAALLIVLVLCVFFFWLGPTVKVVAEHIGSKALGTPLTINELKISPRRGTFHMTGFTIANHTGFGRTNAVSLAGMDLALDVGSIFSPTVLVHRVQIESPHFVYEQNEANDNITRFAQNLQEFLGIDPSMPIENEELPADDDKMPKAIIVEQLEINDVQFFLANAEDPQLDFSVGLERLSLSMTNGVVEVINFTIENPERLNFPYLFTLESIRTIVDPSTLYSGMVSIEDVQISRPYAYLEKNADTDTVAELLKIAQGYTRRASREAGPRPEEPLPPEPEETAARIVPVALHNLTVEDVQIRLLDSTATNATTDPGLLAGISSLSVKLVEGSVLIEEITVPNPPGYQAPNLFHLATLSAALEPDSVFSDQVVITNITVDTPELHLEQKADRGNFSELQAQLTGFIPPRVPSPTDLPEDAEATAPVPLSEQPVVLKQLLINDFSITLALPLTTNMTASLGDNLRSMNPLERLNLEKLNPLTNHGSPSVTNAVPDAEAPLDLVFFDLLQVQPLEGTVSITGMGVANIHGFANEHLVTIEHFSLHLNPETLQSDVLEIEEILIDKPRVSYERQLSTDNIQALQQVIENALARRAEYEAGEPQPESTVDAQSEPKVIITHLLVRDGLVRAKLSALPTAPIPLPNIEMNDVGKAEGGASMRQALTKIGGTFYDTILKSISGTTGFAIDTLKGAGALTLGTLGKATGLGGNDDEASTTGNDEPEASEDSTPDVEQPSTRRKSRSSINRRRPGRIF